MDKKDKLYELIRSMSMAEKRRFTIDATQNTTGKERKYILLFDILVEMKQYDSEALVKVLKDHGYATQHLASDKNYLYNIIIKSLSSFYSGKNTSLNIKEKLHQVEILFERGLYEQCLSILKKLEGQAQKYDLYALLIEIAYWKGKSYEQLGEFSIAAQEVQQILGQMAWLDNRMAFKKLFYQMKELKERIPSTRNQLELEEYKKFISHPFLENEEIPLTFQACLDFWRIHQLYFQGTGELEKELGANLRLLALMDAQSQFIEEFPYEYSIILSRIARLHMRSSEPDFKLALLSLQEFLKKAKKLKRSAEAKVTIDSSLIHLEKLILDKKYEEAENFQAEVEKIAVQHRKHMKKSDIFLSHFLSAIVFVSVKKVKPALDKVNNLLNEHRSAVDRDLQVSLEILNMVVHYLLGNYGLLKYRAKSLASQMNRSMRLYEPEEEIFRFFTKLSSSKTKNIEFQIQLFNETYEKLTEIAKNPLNEKAFVHFDFLEWLDSQRKELAKAKQPSQY